MFSRWQPYPAYLFMCGSASFLRTTLWVVGAVYYVLSVHMNPFQLVLVGTVLEVSYLIFQVPTGAFADMYSRRLSLIVGGIIAGSCWLAQGLVPVFLAIAAAEAVRGLGEACVDGAVDAWLSDEIGEERFGQAMLRGSQVEQITGILGMPAGVALATVHLNLPMVAGGIGLILINLVLALVMPERNFRPAPRHLLTRRSAMRATLSNGMTLIRSKPVLLSILGVALAFGAFSEGFDRLWEAHFLRDISFPPIAHLKPVVWFGVINVVVALLQIIGLQVARKRVDMTDHTAVGRTLLGLSCALIVSVITFGLAGSFALAFAAFVTARVIRRLNGPIYTTWLNQQITDSRVRATVLSLQGGVDALGQSAMGPVIGLIGTIFSLRVAITAAGSVLVSALPLYVWALRTNPALTPQDSAEEAEPVEVSAARRST